MGQPHRPKKGSHGYSPRVRASSRMARISVWPETPSEKPRIQGFAGYKAGMTHVLLVDYRPHSVTSGQEVQVPATVVETPPLRVLAARFYTESPGGLRTLKEIWGEIPDPRIKKRARVPSAPHPFEVEKERVDDVRLLVCTQPALVSGIPLKTPDILEVRVGGGTIPERIEFARSKLSTEIPVTEWAKVGDMVDVASVTKGFGFQGSPVRWGVRLQSHKDSKNRRDTSPLGPFQPRFIRPTVPMPGQTGYHQRTEYNKRILKIGEGSEITPQGGFVGYGIVRNTYVLLHGSIPGPRKRLIRFRDAVRYTRGISVESPQITYVSTSSKQGA